MSASQFVETEETVFKFSDSSSERCVFEFQHVNKKHKFMIAPINNTFAWIAGVSDEGKETKLESGYELTGIRSGRTKKAFSDKLPVIWCDSYRLEFKGIEVLKLECQRQQKVECPPNVKRVKA